MSRNLRGRPDHGELKLPTLANPFEAERSLTRSPWTMRWIESGLVVRVLERLPFHIEILDRSGNILEAHEEQCPAEFAFSTAAYPKGIYTLRLRTPFTSCQKTFTVA